MIAQGAGNASCPPIPRAGGQLPPLPCGDDRCNHGPRHAGTHHGHAREGGPASAMWNTIAGPRRRSSSPGTTASRRSRSSRTTISKVIRRPPLLPLEALPDRRRGLEGATLNAPPGQFGDTIRELSYGVWLDHRRLDYVYRLYGVQAPHHHSPRSGGPPGPCACAQRRGLLVGAHSPWASPRCGEVLRKAAPPAHDAALFLGRHQAGGGSGAVSGPGEVSAALVADTGG